MLHCSPALGWLQSADTQVALTIKILLASNTVPALLAAADYVPQQLLPVEFVDAMWHQRPSGAARPCPVFTLVILQQGLVELVSTCSRHMCPGPGQVFHRAM